MLQTQPFQEVDSEVQEIKYLMNEDILLDRHLLDWSVPKIFYT
jgi:hypothetical protein